MFFEVIHQISRCTLHKKSMILTTIDCFRTVTPVWIHRWLRNDAQSLKWHRRGALLFFKVICQISRLQGPKKLWFGSDLSVSGWQLQFGFMDGYEMTHRASTSMGEVPYCFLRHLSNFKVTQAEKSIWISFEITRPFTAIKFLRFVLFHFILPAQFYVVCWQLIIYILYFNIKSAHMVPFPWCSLLYCHGAPLCMC